MFIYVGGIPGVGKTTIIAKTIELAKEKLFPLYWLNEKKLLCQITGVTSTEEYAKLSIEIRMEARRKMVVYFYKIDEKDFTTIKIRDDHFTAPKENGGFWIRPIDEKDKIHMLAFVVITAKPELIIQRRIVRGLFCSEPGFLDFNRIANHQEMEILVATDQAKSLQIPLLVLKNNRERVEEASTSLLNFIQDIAARKRGLIKYV